MAYNPIIQWMPYTFITIQFEYKTRFRGSHTEMITLPIRCKKAYFYEKPYDY